jgi:purine nucleoside permease
MAGDTWYHGVNLCERAAAWTYCATQQEDYATYMALPRGAITGRVDLNRLAVMRTVSKFDRRCEKRLLLTHGNSVEGHTIRRGSAEQNQ